MGSRGPPGVRGYSGSKGQKGGSGGGVVYTRWGHYSCPQNTGARLLYTGRAAGPHYKHKGGGSNPQCLPLYPTYFKYHSGSQSDISYIYGTEYERTNPLVSNTDDGDVPCAVCYVPTRTSMYMIPARYSCPSGWTREYYGFLMSESYKHYRTQYLCVDSSFKIVSNSVKHDQAGQEFFPVEGRCGTLPCPPYEQTKELTCAVCTK